MGLTFEEQIHRGVLAADAPERALEGAIAAIEAQLGPMGTLLYAFDKSGRVMAHGGRLRAAFERDLSWFQDDPCQDRARGVSGALVHATRMLSRRAYTTSTAYREFYGRHGIEHIVCLRLNGRAHSEPEMCGLFIGRGEDHGDFADEHKRQLLATVPVLAALKNEQARNARLRRMLEGIASVVDEREPVLVFTGDGELLWSSCAARTLFGAAARRCLDGARDLIAGMAAAGRARQSLAVDLGASGAWALEVQSTGDIYVGRLRPARDPEARLAERHGLTPTEAAVLACLGEGMSNVDIGTSLSITALTAATHVKRVLSKMRVASRLKAALIMQREQMKYD